MMLKVKNGIRLWPLQGAWMATRAKSMKTTTSRSAGSFSCHQSGTWPSQLLDLAGEVGGPGYRASAAELSGCGSTQYAMICKLQLGGQAHVKYRAPRVPVAVATHYDGTGGKRGAIGFGSSVRGQTDVDRDAETSTVCVWVILTWVGGVRGFLARRSHLRSEFANEREVERPALSARS
ncbi:unnamed protein product [Phytophthora lilii]|uniref:Unnamed protein product n=1 Tax=Phytophthora lilii TaxID=2077276 RepID=A0A9W6THY0_9STRA|nr:unnamed protein product [Phytophthora lilii]